MGKRKGQEFHPALGLLLAANRKLAPLIDEAARMGIRFMDSRVQGATFSVPKYGSEFTTVTVQGAVLISSAFPEGRVMEQKRYLDLRVELQGGRQAYVELSLGFPRLDVQEAKVTLGTYLHTRKWRLRRDYRAPFEQDASATRLLRALGLERETFRDIPHAEWLEVASIMLKDYEQSEIEPRRRLPPVITDAH